MLAHTKAESTRKKCENTCYWGGRQAEHLRSLARRRRRRSTMLFCATFIFVSTLSVCVCFFLFFPADVANFELSVFYFLLLCIYRYTSAQITCKSKPFDKLGEFTFSAHGLESRVVNSVADAFVPENQKSFCRPRHARNVLYLLWMRPIFSLFSTLARLRNQTK